MELMELIQSDIDKAGGYYIWRDECILENLKPMQSDERQRVLVRLRRSYFYRRIRKYKPIDLM